MSSVRIWDKIFELRDDGTKPAESANNYALIASNGVQSIILDYDGETIDTLITDNGLFTPEDLGVEPEGGLGLWVWTGLWHNSSYDTDCGREHDCEPMGQFRRLTKHELERLNRGESIFR